RRTHPRRGGTALVPPPRRLPPLAPARGGALLFEATSRAPSRPAGREGAGAAVRPLISASPRRGGVGRTPRLIAAGRSASLPRPMTAPVRYKRVLLKLSGEALMGPGKYGIDPETLEAIARAVRQASELGTEVGIVVGGGNIFRGIAASAKGMDRASADYMG